MHAKSSWAARTAPAALAVLVLGLAGPAAAQNVGAKVNSWIFNESGQQLGAAVKETNRAVLLGSFCGIDICDEIENPFDPEVAVTTPGIGSFFGQRSYPTDPILDP
jgi:hypothetical protein